MALATAALEPTGRPGDYPAGAAVQGVKNNHKLLQTDGDEAAWLPQDTNNDWSSPTATEHCRIYTNTTRWITQCSPRAASLHALPTPTGQLARLLPL